MIYTAKNQSPQTVKTIKDLAVLLPADRFGRTPRQHAKDLINNVKQPAVNSIRGDFGTLER